MDEFSLEPHHGLDTHATGITVPVNAGTSAGKPHAAAVYIGGSNWMSGDLIAHAYPPGTHAAKYLHEYSRLFNSCQLDLTFYKNFSVADISKWVAEVKNPDFRFCPVLFNKLTFQTTKKRLKLISDAAFFDTLPAFGANLGPLIIQMPEKFKASHLLQFYGFIQGLPKAGEYFLDLPDESWYRDDVLPVLKQYLNVKKVGLIINDLPSKPVQKSSISDMEKCYIRFTPGEDENMNKMRLSNWYQQIKTAETGKLKEAYFMVINGQSQQVKCLRYLQHLFER